MKRCFLLLFFLPVFLNAQSNLTLHLRARAAAADPSAVFRVLVKGNPDRVREAVNQHNGHFAYAAGNICSVALPAGELESFAASPGIERIEEGCINLRPLNDTMKIQNNVTPVHNGVSPLPQGYDGTGVIMGLIDSGIDFTHPDFLDSAGKSRVLYIWEQSPTSGSTVPQPYNYGIEWRKGQIDSGLCTHTDLTYYGHGTHVSGIAAGDGSSTNLRDYRGVAYKSDIILVALDFYNSGPAVADAADYIFTKAAALGRPCVINASVGDYYGSHDGLDLQTTLIENLLTAQNGRSVVGASGNAGNEKIHLGYTTNGNTNFTWFVPPASGPLYIQMWGDTNSFDATQVAIAVDQNTTYARRGQSNYTTVVQNLSGLSNDTIRNANNDRLATVQRAGSTQASAYEFEFLVTPDSISGYYITLLTTGSGTFHTWSFDVYSGAVPTLVQLPTMVDYHAPDTTYTVVSSFQCSDKVICVGNYVNRDRWLDYNGNYTIDPTVTTSAIMWNSSVGPTRDGRIKPDICATGANILSCGVLSVLPSQIASGPQYIGLGGYHVVGGGTSAASPVVAGVAALYLQRYPNATWSDVRNAIVNCSRQDAFTGSNLPNVTWGNGKVDAFSALVGCPALATSIESGNILLNVFPNPAQDQFTVNFNTIHGKAELLLYDAQGRTVRHMALAEGQEELKLSCRGLSPGLYLCAISENGHVAGSRRIVVQ